MQKPTRFGICSLVGCVGSFCLSTVTGLPQDAKPADVASPAPSQESPLTTNAPSLRQLQEQNLAMLKALEQLREDREAALTQYTETIANQLNVLRDALISQREQELRAAEDSNRFVLTIAASVACVAVVIMLISALLPVWALKRFTETRAAADRNVRAPRPPEARGLFPPGQSTVGSEPGLALLDILGEKQIASHLDGAVEKLEQRLLALEKLASQPPAVLPDSGTPAQGQRPEARGQKEESGKIPTPAAKTIAAPGKPEPAVGKASQTAHVAIRLGEGEAISFVPREEGLTKFHSLRALLDKFKKVFHRTIP